MEGWTGWYRILVGQASEGMEFRLQSHYVNCLNSGERFQTSGEDNLITLKLTFDVYDSASKHESIIYNTY
jgi:hypothetical protein